MEVEGALELGSRITAVVVLDGKGRSVASFLQERNANSWKNTETNYRRSSREWRSASRSLRASERRRQRGGGSTQSFRPFTSHDSIALYLDPFALKAIVKKQSRQVSHAHIPHRNPRGHHENEEVLLIELEIPDDEGEFHSGKKEDHP